MKDFYTLFFIILLILISIATGYYYTIYKADKEPQIEEQKVKKDPLKVLNQQLIDLEIKKNFWKNKIKLAEQEQFNFFMDLSDSIATLEISGIIAHSSTILNYEISENLRILKQEENIIRMLRDPLHIIEDWASVPKDPIRVKDISGFEWNPDTLNFVPNEIDTEFVFIVFKCSKEISVMISQRAIAGEMPSYIEEDYLTKFHNLANTQKKDKDVPFSDLIQKNWIGIEVARSDAIALYRAINEQSLLTLCL
jgi:hypothetical protein